MLSNRQLFLQHLAQTSDSPMMLEIERAEGVYLYDHEGKKYLDLISGISVSNVGHRHPKVITAIEAQLEKYLHIMVYGEYIESPQVQYAKLLTDHLPSALNTVYFTNSGAEAAEGALKLARRFTGRSEVVSFRNGYHGSTMGALSVMGNEDFRNHFRPHVPGNKLLPFNQAKEMVHITGETAVVIVEPVQGEAGVILPDKNFLMQLRNRCNETGTLLIFDECQTAFGRTGTLWCFEQYPVVPDILLLAKALGGGMPLGAFISGREIMKVLSTNPPLGHITTFGGHPVCCAAGKAALEVILEENLVSSVKSKRDLFEKNLRHAAIKDIRAAGLLIAIEFETDKICKDVVSQCIEQGIVIDWFLFSSQSMRIAPPLTITEEEIKKACSVILHAIDTVTS